LYASRLPGDWTLSPELKQCFYDSELDENAEEFRFRGLPDAGDGAGQ
jgi:hypothetical protein